MDFELTKKQLGLRLKALRLSKGLKQEDLENYGFSYRHYGKIERGQVNPTMGTIVKLCDLFNISLSDLFSSIDRNKNLSDQNETISVQINNILNENDESKLRKLKVFLDEII